MRHHRPAHFLLSLPLLLVVLSACGPGPWQRPDQPEANTPIDVGGGIEPDVLVQLGGVSEVVVLDGDRAYLGLGPRVVQLDIADPRAPKILGQSPVLPGVVRGLAVDSPGKRLWAALGESGWAVVDLSAGASMSLLDAGATPALAHDVAYEDGNVFVAFGWAGLLVLDDSGTEVGRLVLPHDPEQVFGSYDARRGLAARDGLVYFAGGDLGLHVIDATNPRSPRRIGALNTPREVNDVVLENDLAYLQGIPLRIVDVSDPARPRAVYPLPGPTDSTTYAGWESTSVTGVAVEDGIVVSQARVIDARLPDRPTAVALSAGPSAGEFSRPALRDGIAYLPAGEYEGGLRLVDVHDPASPTPLWEVRIRGSVPRLLDAGGRQLWLTGISTDSYHVDVSSPMHPVVTVAEPPASGAAGEGRFLEASGYAYFAYENNLVTMPSETFHRLALERATAFPTDVYTLTTSANASEMLASGSHLFLADSGWEYDLVRSGPKYLEVVSIAAPDRPRVVAKLEFQHPLDAIAIDGSTAWVAQRAEDDLRPFYEPIDPADEWPASEIVAIDISRPEAPRIVARAPAQALVQDLLALDGSLYAATMRGLERFRVDAGRLETDRVVALPGGSAEIVEAAGALWIAAWDAGLIGLPLPLPDAFARSAPDAPALLEVLAAPPSQAGASPPPAPRLDATPVPKRRSARVGGVVSVIAAAGTSVFIGQEWNVFAMDATVPDQPRFRGRSPVLDGPVRDLAVDGSRLYVATGAAGVQCIDTSDPRHLEPIAGCRLEAPVDQLAIDGRMLYGADSDTGRVSILSLGDDRLPEVGQSDAGGPLQDIAAADGYVYLARGRSGLHIVDVRAPSAPVALPPLTNGLVATALAVDSGYAYVVDGARIVRIVEVTDPARAREVARFEAEPGISRIRVADGRLFLLNPEREKRLTAVDVSDPRLPRELAWGRNVNGGGHSDFVVFGERALVTDEWAAGLFVLTLGDHPTDDDRRSAARATKSWSEPTTVSVLGDFVFKAEAGERFSAMSGHGEIHVVDLTDPEVPRQSAALDLGYSHFAVDGHYLLIGRRDDQATVDLFDLATPMGLSPLATASLGTVADGGSSESASPTDPNRPDTSTPSVYRFLSLRYASPGSGSDVHERAVVSVLREGEVAPIAVFDIGYDKHASDAGVTTRDEDRGLLVTYGRTMRVFDIRQAPAREVGVLEFEDDRAVALFGGYGYRASDQAITVIDLRDPSAPHVVATRNVVGRLTPGVLPSYFPVAADAGYLYVAEDRGEGARGTGIGVYDLADPLAPEPVDYFDTALAVGGFDGFRASGPYLQVIGHGGVHVFRNDLAFP